jgi:ATP-binding cassette subfamily F protein uup
MAEMPREKPGRKETAKPRQERRKLSYKQQRALEQLPGQIEALDRDIATLEAKLADPQLYASDPAGFEQAAAVLAKARQTRDAAEEEWLELEMLREEIEAG